MTAQCQEKGQIRTLLIQNLIVNLKTQKWSTNMAYSYTRKPAKKKKKKGMTKKAKPMKMRKMRY
tara:strand:- start:422 stop:613 length:192 start_codon:yes stop_codon:yes gene_type:complete